MTATETQYVVKMIPVSEIFSDADFNCRGTIIPIDVVDLAKDIEINGLQFPIAVQPADDVEHPLPPGCKYRIIAGHRRFAAYGVLKWKIIPAMIKVGLSEIQARLLNLGENLKRKDLNIKQEASAVDKLRRLGMTQEEVGRELGVSRSWVQVRFNLLDLPPAIQEEAAAGVLNQNQIKQLYSLPSNEDRYEAVRKIKMAKDKGNRGVDVGKRPAQDPFKKKKQPATNVLEMMETMSSSIGFGLHTRALAWSIGEISTVELFYDMQKFAEENGLEFNLQIPTA